MKKLTDKMKKEIVTTVSGIEVDKSQCRLINKEYYLIGINDIENSGDVYLIDGRYIRFSTGRLVFNHSSKSYQLKNENLVYGVIEMDKNCNFTMGYFNYGIDNQWLVDKDSSLYCCIDDSIINRSYREEISSGKFYHISLKKASSFNLIKNVSRETKESFPYDSKGIMNRFIDRYNNKYNPVISKSISKYSKALGDLTFGFEFETIKGMIPRSKIEQLPLIPLRDGSISGLEYVTIPLSGDKGIKALIDCVKELDRRTVYDNSCSMHLHIGNVPRTPDFILAFYKLISSCQDEIFSMFPLYKKYNFEVKRKNYSKEFPVQNINFYMDPSIDPNNKDQLNKNFDVLFSHLAEITSFGDYDYDLNRVNHHPCDQNGNQKWNIKNRYYAVNFIPLIFGNKETIEFRIHTPTYDIDKILNFLLINSYLINFTIENKESILKNPYFIQRLGKNIVRGLINDHLVKNKQFSNKEKEDLISYSVNYIEERKRTTYHQNCCGNILGNEEDIFCNKSIDWENNKFKKPEMFKKYGPIDDLAIKMSKPSFEKTIDDLRIKLNSYKHPLMALDSIGIDGNADDVVSGILSRQGSTKASVYDADNKLRAKKDVENFNEFNISQF